MADSFYKFLNDSDVGQLISLVGNFSATFQVVLGFLSLLNDNTSDTQKVLDAIDGLQQDLDRDYRQLGDLVATQAQIIVDTVNRDAMALALSRSDIAADRIQEFLSTNNGQALETAKTESIGGVRFFTELGLTAPDLPFFLPGLVKAGTIRIFVIAAEPLALREPRAVVVDDVNTMITSLASMIGAIKRKVDAAHSVRQINHYVRCLPLPQLAPPQLGAGSTYRTVLVIDGYTHEENGVRLAFFDAQRGNLACNQPSGFEGEARAAAVQARSKGVADELAFLGIPGFDQILQSWRSLLTA